MGQHEHGLTARMQGHTEVVGQNGISDGDVTCHTLVESTVCKDTEGSSQMLFTVETFILERSKLGVRSDA